MSRQFSYSSVPILRKRRNAFDLSHDVFTSMSAGILYPLDVQEVYPGDTFKCDETVVSRVTSAYLRPVMDNAVMEVHHFFVPNRLTMDDWTAVMGENKASAWAPANPTNVPYIASGVIIPSGGVEYECTSNIVSGTVLDYCGIPVNYNDDGTLVTYETDDPEHPFEPTQIAGEISILPARGFALIYDEWFRDQNNIDPMLVQKGSSLALNEIPNNNDWSPTNYVGKLPHVAKMHDYFTSALPGPQKGDAVTFAGSQLDPRILPTAPIGVDHVRTGTTSLSLFPQDSVLSALATAAGYDITAGSSNRTPLGEPLLTYYNDSEKNQLYMNGRTSVGGLSALNPSSSDFGGGMSFNTSVGTAATGGDPALFTNFATYDPGAVVRPVSVNELRYAIALQRMLEKDAVGGTRYTSLLLSHFGVSSPDARLQRTEYLGGKMFPLNVQQVAQTSQATETSPLGALAGYSLSNGRAGYTKGIVEHGFIITVGFIRQYRHTYQQGIEKFWSRSKRTDFFDPVFDGIGEQPIYKKELFALDLSANPDDPFGYRPAWDDLRGRQSHVTGQMRSGLKKSLDIWHFGDVYVNEPSLNQSFINETSEYIDRTLAVPASTQDQFIINMHMQVKAYRPLSLYGTPSQLGIK